MSGEGRGVITRDGCAVDVYRELPYRGELETIEGHLPDGCSVLELGSGTGRLTRRLVDRGHPVTAVDNATAMLDHVPDAATRVCCDIERLALDRTFDVVLLASHLINVADDAMRHEQLVACRRHLAPGGALLFQRFDPEWLRTVQAGAFPSSGVVDIAIERVQRHGEDVDMTIRYAIGPDEWKQHFTARILDDDDVARMFDAAGLSMAAWIDRRWGVARPRGGRS